VLIRDQLDHAVCEINTRLPGGAARQNAALIQHAPQLLAAVIEYAYNAHSQGIGVQQELLDLIHRAGGPRIDLDQPE
jgi:hypothetical protein